MNMYQTFLRSMNTMGGLCDIEGVRSFYPASALDWVLNESTGLYNITEDGRFVASCPVAEIEDAVVYYANRRCNRAIQARA